MQITTAHISDVRRERLNHVAPLIYIENNGIRGSYSQGSFPEMALLQGSHFPLPCMVKIVPPQMIIKQSLQFYDEPTKPNISFFFGQRKANLQSFRWSETENQIGNFLDQLD